MNSEEVKNFCFFCWQLNIKTLGDLAAWKEIHNAKTSTETMEALEKAYNGAEWEKINGMYKAKN